MAKQNGLSLVGKSILSRLGQVWRSVLHPIPVDSGGLKGQAQQREDISTCQLSKRLNLVGQTLAKGSEVVWTPAQEERIQDLENGWSELPAEMGRGVGPCDLLRSGRYAIPT